MSKSGFVCLVVGLGLVGCGGGGECPDGYLRVGGLCVQSTVDSGEPIDAAAEGDGAIEIDAGVDASATDAAIEIDATVDVDAAIEVDAAVEVDAATPCVPRAETCNELDDDCDDVIDEGIKLPSVMDDLDGDGYGDEATSRLGCLLDGRVTRAGDCADTDASRHPGASEICDGIDQNCSGVADEGVLSVFYRDMDGDGHGSSSVTVAACALPAGYVASSDDCNDVVATTYTGATEVCDDFDQDCDGTADDGLALVTYYRDADADGFAPVSATTVRHCARADGAPPTGTTAQAPTSASSRDCYDSDARAFPGQTLYFSGAIIGAPATSTTRFDYDCNGLQQRRYEYSACDAEPPVGCSTVGALPGFTTTVSCGATGTLLTACGPVMIGGTFDFCHATTRASVPQECR